MHPKSGPRRRHSDELKAKVLAACDEPGASISGVALAHGLNANLVRKWRSGRGAKLAGTAITAAASKATPPLGTTAEFVAIEMPAPAKAAARAAAEATAAAPISEPLIQIELRRGRCTSTCAGRPRRLTDCRAWLSELSSGLLK